jgi:alpha-glucosidase
MRRVVDVHQGEPVLIGEVYLKIDELAAYYGAELDGLQLPTNFNFLWTPWKAAPILDMVEAYEGALPRGAWPNWVLGNHDQSRTATRVGPAQARIAMMLLLTLRGTPIVYYGDELGLEDMAIAPDRVRDPFGLNMPGTGQGRDPERCPMPWDETPKAGFTTGEPWLPIGASRRCRSVVAQRKDQGSMLALVRQILWLRRDEPALSRGRWSPLPVEGEVLAYARSLEDKRFIIVLNLEDKPKRVLLLDPISGRILLSTHGRNTGQAIRQGLELAANEGLVIAT